MTLSASASYAFLAALAAVFVAVMVYITRTHLRNMRALDERVARLAAERAESEKTLRTTVKLIEQHARGEFQPVDPVVGIGPGYYVTKNADSTQTVTIVD
ncbi:MAG: hypothetical protein ACK4OE_09055 [Acidovorax sp.]|uniref:hypothetical protein n=1 Tax=Acidovorax sp. TaxID=1872122 RepID=UPI00391A9552